jgi:excisionase family DNA binding protein
MDLLANESRNSKTTPKRLSISEHRHIEVKDIADYCMVSTSTVRRWLNAGKLKSIKLPSNQFRISTEDFKDFLERYNIPIEDGLFQ